MERDLRCSPFSTVWGKGAGDRAFKGRFLMVGCKAHQNAIITVDDKAVKVFEEVPTALVLC